MCQAVIYHLYDIKCNSKYLSHDDRKSIVQYNTIQYPLFNVVNVLS